MQELVLLEARGLADDLAVLDRPERRVAVPAGQVLAVEEVLATFSGVASIGTCAGLAQVGDQRADLVSVSGLSRSSGIIDWSLGCRSSMSSLGSVERLVGRDAA